MKIEKLSDTAFKIIISAGEMRMYNIDFENLDKDNISAELMINEILKKINRSTGINLSSSRLFIEAFAVDEDMDCILYISVADETDEEIYEPYIYYIFDFENIENCTGFLRHLLPENLSAITQASLYTTGSFYRLAVKIKTEYEDIIVSCASEFGTVSGYDETALAYTDEHYECIIRDNAVQELFIF